MDDAATPAEEEIESFDDADDVNVDAGAGAEEDVLGISSLIKSPHTLAIAGSIAGSPEEDTPPVVLRRPPPTGAMP